MTDAEWEARLRATMERHVGPRPSELEWEAMTIQERSQHAAAMHAAYWEHDWQHTVAAIMKFTDLTRTEALMLVLLQHSRDTELFIKGLRHYVPPEDEWRKDA